MNTVLERHLCANVLKEPGNSVKIKSSPSLVSAVGCSSHWRFVNSGSSSSGPPAGPSDRLLMRKHRQIRKPMMYFVLNIKGNLSVTSDNLHVLPLLMCIKTDNILRFH